MEAKSSHPNKKLASLAQFLGLSHFRPGAQTEEVAGSQEERHDTMASVQGNDSLWCFLKGTQSHLLW